MVSKIKNQNIRQTSIKSTEEIANDFHHKSTDLELSMQINIDTMKAMKIAHKKILEAQNHYNEIIENTVKYESTVKERILSLMEVLNKKDCKSTEEKLREFFLGSHDKNDEIENANDQGIFASIAQQKIEHRDRVKRIRDDIKKFQKLLEEVLSFEDSSNINEFFDVYCDDDFSILTTDDLKKTFFQSISSCLLKTKNFTKKAKGGRPDIRELYVVVEHLYILYKDIMGELPSIFRHSQKENGEKKYIPVTAGHIFISNSIDLLNFMFCHENPNAPLSKYTDKNIYNACEKVSASLNKGTPINPLESF